MAMSDLMGRVFFVFTLCYVTILSSASVSPQDYWKSKLPNTPIPQPIRDSLLPSATNGNPVLQTRPLRKFLGDGVDTKPIVEAYIQSHANKRSLSSVSNTFYPNRRSENKIHHHEESNNQEFTIPTIPIFYSNRHPEKKIYAHGEDSNTNKEFTVPTIPIFYSNRVQLEDAIHHNGEESNNKEFTVPTIPIIYSNRQAEESNKEEFTIPKIPIFYSNKQTEESSNKEFTVPTIPIFYSKRQTEKSNNEKFRAPTIPIFYSTRQPKSNEFISDKQYTVPTIPIFYSERHSKHKVEKDGENSNKKEEHHIIFVEEDLKPGKTLKMQFKKGTKKSIFLPREVANKIPFSSVDLEETLNLLSIDRKSSEAKVISEQITVCEEAAIEGLKKHCPTSLESMVDFVASNIGKDVRAMTTMVEKDNPKMEYRIEKVERLAKNDNETITCHKQDYPYAMYYCHGSPSLRPYMVSMVGEDGTKIEAIASCHKEVGGFMKSYLVNVMKVVPGTTRLCHIAPAEDNIFFIAN